MADTVTLLFSDFQHSIKTTETPWKQGKGYLPIKCIHFFSRQSFGTAQNPVQQPFNFLLKSIRKQSTN